MIEKARHHAQEFEKLEQLKCLLQPYLSADLWRSLVVTKLTGKTSIVETNEGVLTLSWSNSRRAFTAYCATRIDNCRWMQIQQNTAMKSRAIQAREFIMKDGYSFHANYDSLDVTMMNTRQLMADLTAVASTTKPSSVMVMPYWKRSTRVYGCYTCSLQTGPLGCFRQINWLPLLSPSRSQKKSKQIAQMDDALVKIPLPIQMDPPMLRTWKWPLTNTNPVTVS